MEATSWVGAGVGAGEQAINTITSTIPAKNTDEIFLLTFLFMVSLVVWARQIQSTCQGWLAGLFLSKSSHELLFLLLAQVGGDQLKFLTF